MAKMCVPAGPNIAVPPSSEEKTTASVPRPCSASASFPPYAVI